MAAPSSTSCLRCRHFDNSPAALEAALPGLSSLSSAYAAVRGNDGLCSVHQRYVTAESTCQQFDARALQA
jgi:hypothetical protein